VAHLVARDDLTGMRVVELGCGVGLTGLAAAALGARVVLTDRDSHVLAQAAANIDLNKPALLEAGGRAATFKLDWRDSAALQMLLREHGPFDLIVASDVLYSASLFPSLLHTIDALSSSSVGPAADAVTLTLIACPERDNRSHAKGGDYFAAMANGERAGKAALVRTHYSCHGLHQTLPGNCAVSRLVPKLGLHRTSFHPLTCRGAGLWTGVGWADVHGR
jgi:hypothetical protein